MRKEEFCYVCGNFTSCFRYLREWLCESCPKEKVEKLKNVQPIAKIPVKETAIKPQTVRIKFDTKPKKIQHSDNRSYKLGSNILNGCKYNLTNFFDENPDVVFKSHELKKLFPKFPPRSIGNTLSRMVAEGIIYSRKISINGSTRYAIYSTNKELVEKLVDEEIKLDVVHYVHQNYPVTTKQLSNLFNISDTAVTKRIKKTQSLKTFTYLNRNFYFPKDKESEVIPYIKENYSW